MVCSRSSYKEECIPVECVPPAAVAIPGGFSTRHPPKSRPRPGAAPPPREQTPFWTEFLTQACENITLPQTSFAGGNNISKCTFYILYSS